LIVGGASCRVIPEGTQLNLHTFSIHRDERNFHTPEAFLPERWFSKDAPEGEHNTSAFFPFSYGPTICAGKNLALMEMRMVLCWVLRCFRFSVLGGPWHRLRGMGGEYPGLVRDSRGPSAGQHFDQGMKVLAASVLLLKA